VYFIDANIFIRVLTQDDPARAAQALALLERIADGQISGMMTESVILEIIQVLGSKPRYALDHAEIRERLLPLLLLPHLQVEHREVQLAAIDLFGTTRLDYVDCLAISYARLFDLDGIVSFDRGLDRHAPGLRFEPEVAGTVGQQEQQPTSESVE
jgi:predicted nucleic acid-binding protein